MPGLLLHTGALVQCPHLAPASIAPAQTQVLVSGQPVAIVDGEDRRGRMSLPAAAGHVLPRRASRLPGSW